MAQTIKTLLYDAVKYEETLLAHAVFIAVQDGLVSLEDSAEGFEDLMQSGRLDFEKVVKAKEENMLCMNPVKLFAVPTQPGSFAFILAHREEDAAKEFVLRYNRKPERVLDMWHEMDRSFYFPDTGKHMSFREIKEQTASFPHFVFEYQKPKREVAA